MKGKPAKKTATKPAAKKSPAKPVIKPAAKPAAKKPVAKGKGAAKNVDDDEFEEFTLDEDFKVEDENFDNYDGFDDDDF